MGRLNIETAMVFQLTLFKCNITCISLAKIYSQNSNREIVKQFMESNSKNKDIKSLDFYSIKGTKGGCTCI